MVMAVLLLTIITRLRWSSSVVTVDWAQALEALRKLRTEKTSDIKSFKLAHEHTKTHKAQGLHLLNPHAGVQNMCLQHGILGIVYQWAELRWNNGSLELVLS